MTRLLGLVLTALLLTGCAGMNRPRTYAYPAYGQHAGQQADDHVTCEQWAPRPVACRVAYKARQVA